MSADGPSTTLDVHRDLGAARTLLVVLGDQLDAAAPALAALDLERDALLMMEVREEAEHVPSHPQRTTLFLAAMRHFARERIDEGWRLRYVRLDERGNAGSLAGELGRQLGRVEVERVRVQRPGEHRVTAAFEALAEEGAPLEIVEDERFLCGRADFAAWARGRKQIVLEHFYRWQRKRLGLLVDGDGQPEGGRWNFDADNREPFREAPEPPPPARFAPDAVTREVMELVGRRFPDAYGRLEGFAWPVTRAQALEALDDFVAHRLPRFGTHQDAMWPGEPFLYHSLLGAPLNLGLLRPREVVDAALAAYERDEAPLGAVEGFVRQIVGWRELVRGIYELEGPTYEARNALEHHGALPELYWTAETDMACVADGVDRVLEHAYGHHIERLMVLGNLALLLGVAPEAIHRWFLAMYVDGVAWATAPNVIGMSQHADGGIVGTKPYAGAANYIRRMGAFCDGCRYAPDERVGEDACPFNALYWDFLARHRERFASNRRMSLILANLDRFEPDELEAMRRRAAGLRGAWGVGAVAP